MFDLTAFHAVLATLFFSCTNPTVQIIGEHDMPWKGGYFYENDGHVIRIKKSAWDSPERNKIIMHELFHCALYENREKHGYPHPKPLDPREEMTVRALTDAAMERL